MANPTPCEELPGESSDLGGKLLADKQKLIDGILAWRDVINSSPIDPSIFKKFLDFDKELILHILSIQNCAGIRIFPVVDAEGKHSVMIVPKDINGEEIFSNVVAQTIKLVTQKKLPVNKSVKSATRNIAAIDLQSSAMVCCPHNGTSSFSNNPR